MYAKMASASAKETEVVCKSQTANTAELCEKVSLKQASQQDDDIDASLGDSCVQRSNNASANLPVANPSLGSEKAVFKTNEEACDAAVDPGMSATASSSETLEEGATGASDDWEHVSDDVTDMPTAEYPEHSVDPKTIERPRCPVPGDSPYTESSCAGSQEDEGDESSQDDGLDGSERIASIEEEYIDRIAILEQRHYELEDVLTRLTSALEIALAETDTTSNSDAPVTSPPETAEGDQKAEGEQTAEEEQTSDGEKEKVVLNVTPEETSSEQEREGEPVVSGREFARRISYQLFLEFQQKIRQFGNDLNGVLNCAESALRHSRVVQEWATSVQIMFEQTKEERQKILNYIDEREKNMLTVKEQFIEELQEQGKQLQYLVHELKSNKEMRERGEAYYRSKSNDASEDKELEESVIDVLMRRRLDEEKSVILSLSKQSKISEMKLFIIHQQNCIQQLQEQNRELRAIVEGFMQGPDEMEFEEDTDPSGTPASVTTPDRSPAVADLLEPLEEPGSPSLVSDVLHCDRGDYLPGTSTDGDIATIQAYEIGSSPTSVPPGEKIVFDPLTVNYVKDQCRQAEETERRIHEAENIVRDGAVLESIVLPAQSGSTQIAFVPYFGPWEKRATSGETNNPDVEVLEDPDVAMVQAGLEQLKVELEAQESREEQEALEKDKGDLSYGGGDRPSPVAEKTVPLTPPAAGGVGVTSQTETDVVLSPKACNPTEDAAIPVPTE